MGGWRCGYVSARPRGALRDHASRRRVRQPDVGEAAIDAAVDALPLGPKAPRARRRLRRRRAAGPHQGAPRRPHRGDRAGAGVGRGRARARRRRRPRGGLPRRHARARRLRPRVLPRLLARARAVAATRSAASPRSTRRRRARARRRGLLAPRAERAATWSARRRERGRAAGRAAASSRRARAPRAGRCSTPRSPRDEDWAAYEETLIANGEAALAARTMPVCASGSRRRGRAGSAPAGRTRSASPCSRCGSQLPLGKELVSNRRGANDPALGSYSDPQPGRLSCYGQDDQRSGPTTVGVVCRQPIDHRTWQSTTHPDRAVDVRRRRLSQPPLPLTSSRARQTAPAGPHHARGRAPDQVVADLVGVGAERHAAADRRRSAWAARTASSGQLEHVGDLGLRDHPREARLDQPDERIDGVVGDERRRRRQRADDLDRVGRQPDLLVRLAQGGGGEVGVLGVAAPAGERDLAGVALEVVAALGEDGCGSPCSSR